MPKKSMSSAQRERKKISIMTPEQKQSYLEVKAEKERLRFQKQNDNTVIREINNKSNSLAVAKFVPPTLELLSTMAGMTLDEEESSGACKTEKDNNHDLSINSVTFDESKEYSSSLYVTDHSDEEFSPEIMRKEMCDQLCDIAIYMQEKEEQKTLEKFTEPEPDVQLLCPSEIVKLADECIEVGNAFYWKSKKKAVVCYNKALQYVPYYTKALLKRAGAYMALNWLKLAMKDVKSVMEREPENEKAEWLESSINDRGWEMEECEYLHNFESFVSPGSAGNEETNYSLGDNTDYAKLKAEFINESVEFHKTMESNVNNILNRISRENDIPEDEYLNPSKKMMLNVPDHKCTFNIVKVCDTCLQSKKLSKPSNLQSSSSTTKSLLSTKLNYPPNLQSGSTTTKRKLDSMKSNIPFHNMTTVPVLDETKFLIYGKKDEFIKVLSENDIVLVLCSTGSGKTLSLSRWSLQYLLSAKKNTKVFITQPRRVAVKEAYASLQGLCQTTFKWEPDSGKLGLAIRHKSNVTRDTRIVVQTEGYLWARIAGNKEQFRDTGVLILDECHMRSLNMDMILAYAKYLPSTLNGNTTALNDVMARHIVMIHLFNGPGYILAFCSGKPECEKLSDSVEEMLEIEQRRLPHLKEHPLKIVIVHGQMDLEQQQMVMKRKPDNMTIENVVYVIDNGLHKVNRFDPVKNGGALVEEPISKSSAKQRAGRTGRIGKGIVYRMYSVSEYTLFKEHDEPEILICDLKERVLQLLRMGYKNITNDFPWFEHPDPINLLRAVTDCYDLWLLEDDGSITERGDYVSKMFVDIRHAVILTRAKQLNVLNYVASIVPLLRDSQSCVTEYFIEQQFVYDILLIQPLILVVKLKHRHNRYFLELFYFISRPVQTLF